ncbi:MAG: NAD(P)H-dependent glycerol-3-phosphate dehydrogenase [Candidatus Kapabacteria bacterium]|nr:NAD(P)H-dependent glycerol-3-phosphate dehydrogenase [Candidatus Kapabacteria bacterium]
MNIGIIGAGGWGTALAMVAAQNNHAVTLWARKQETADEINTHHTNTVFLPGVSISETITATTSAEIVSAAEMLVIAIPTQFIRSVVTAYPFSLSGKTIANASKGIERNTLLRVSQILRQTSNVHIEDYVMLTGPSHAEETVRNVPTTVLAASLDEDSASKVQDVFTTPTFRCYRSNDVIGAELGGALKNVIAIAAGIIDGLGTGDNTKAALITRGLAEMARLGAELGANPLTFSGLSGLGDLIVTCDSKHSRNRRVGELLGKGKPLAEILDEMHMVAEGVSTTESAYALARKRNVEMPIVEQVYEILFNNKPAPLAIRDLMTRESKREIS